MKFAGSKVYTSACFLKSGGIVDGSYTTTEKTTLTVATTSPSGVATKIKGTLDLVFVPTAIGTSHHCGRDHLTLSYLSLRKLT
jgi:hypothetical protein